MVATTVIEVGIDAPNAHGQLSLKTLSGSGLSQLHQLRGRVAAARKIFLFFYYTSRPPTVKAENKTQGLLQRARRIQIAEMDLQMRARADGRGRAGRVG